MKREITGFHRDDESYWVAELDCGHGRHVRHVPPFSERAWVESAEGRAARLGTALECVRCDRAELPEGHAPYRRTPTFTEASIPQALLSAHSTKRGVWGLIHVASGRLDYHVEAPVERHEVVEPGSPGVILPEVEHRVACSGPVEFFVEFWRAS